VKTAAKYLTPFNSFTPSNELTCFINSSFIPTQSFVDAIKNLEEGESLYKNGTIAASMVHVGKTSFEKEIKYSDELLKLSFPWDIFSLNEKALTLDFERICKNRKSVPLSQSNQLIGPKEKLFIEEGATVEGSILNTNTGYIYIGKNAEIMEGSVVRGSLALCEHATLKLATKIYGATTIGPYSKVGGEVNNSILLGYSNKGHDGFLGNSVLGEWCNLGADTNNSNLKNNYGKIKCWNYEQKKMIDSDLQFLGLIMGDHSKTGINTMLNTGTVVGVSSNIYGADFPPKFIPSFSWGSAQGFVDFDFDKALEVAERMMGRRKKELSDADKSILNHIFEEEKTLR
jgi:UDP-N-acetylglucosamine diphosphorylase/glucosamine-1-phosphate N-acetyltransferase